MKGWLCTSTSLRSSYHKHADNSEYYKLLRNYLYLTHISKLLTVHFIYFQKMLPVLIHFGDRTSDNVMLVESMSIYIPILKIS